MDVGTLSTSASVTAHSIVSTLSYVLECSEITVSLWLSLYMLWSMAISDTISTLYH